MTMNTGARGYVACLDMGEDPENYEGVISRVQRFLDSGNLSDVGQMRYLYAEKVDDDTTYYLSIFSDADMNLYEMFPAEGDAPGVDPITRPEGSRRLLSSYEEGRPYGVTVFSSEGAHGEAFIQHFESSLPSAGWDAMTVHDGERTRVDGVTVLSYASGERLLNVNVFEEDGLTVATVLTSDEFER